MLGREARNKLKHFIWFIFVVTILMRIFTLRSPSRYGDTVNNRAEGNSKSTEDYGKSAEVNSKTTLGYFKSVEGNSKQTKGYTRSAESTEGNFKRTEGNSKQFGGNSISTEGNLLLEGNSITSNVSKPNILFIVADDYGYNDIGYHGSEIKTPNLDKLAMAGVRLENYYVQPLCTPTRSQLLTGRYQIHTGLQSGIIWHGEPSSIPLDSKTIADKLADAGYSTHMVGKWHLGYPRREYLPTRRGFHSFFGFLNGHNDYFTYTSRYKHYRGYDLRENEAPADIRKYIGKYSTHVFTDKVIDLFKNQKSGQPLFVYLPFQAPHTPLQVPESYLDQYKHIEQSGRRKYAAMVSCMDEAVGNITQALKDLGVWENTLLIFTSDNGAEFSYGSNRPLRGFKGSYWEGAVRAVGFVHGKLLNRKLTGSVSKELLHITDWFPTLVNLAGGDFDGTKPLDGYDQRECIFEGKSSKRNEILINIDPLKIAPGRPLFNNTFDTTISASLRMGPWKLVTGVSRGGPARKSRNFNLWLLNIEKDPNELLDFSDQYPSVVQYMLKRLESYHNTSVPVVKPPEDPMANPDLHGGFWGPWQDDPVGVFPFKRIA